ncbi:protein ATP1B4 isoform X2 [Phyllostomus hastatus]|uniref:protein ATP1B4 isoform X2 n=1 Tax=Phyllostomus hastatus TaxID=9423 RepID=UPI001E680B9D|nr:protein ATP1B4 isoform X2 [Phyllostomus hastatus]
MRRQLRSRRAPAFPHSYRYRLDDQDEVNQNYLADEEEEAEEEARVMLVPDLEEEEEEEEEGEKEEKKEKEEGQGQPTGNTWWWKLQIMNEYLWDPEKRMFLARTGLILVIYFFFYASLAAVITLCMYTLFLNISPYMPTFTERVKPPGVMIRPFAHSLNFNFNVSEPDTWQHYVISLNGFLQGYNDSLQEEMNVDCPPGQYFIQDANEDEDKKACQFKRSFLKNCSGLDDPTFGYSTGQPCILLKMNRVYWPLTLCDDKWMSRVGGLWKLHFSRALSSPTTSLVIFTDSISNINNQTNYQAIIFFSLNTPYFHSSPTPLNLPLLMPSVGNEILSCLEQRMTWGWGERQCSYHKKCIFFLCCHALCLAEPYQARPS